jgi:hypothetical protein
MNNLKTLKEGIAEFKELTKEYGTTLISYSWDAGHAYSMLDSNNEGGTKLSMLTTEMSVLSGDEENTYHDVMNEWLSDNDECPPCVPGGECECSDINDIDTIRQYRRAHDKVYGIGKFTLYHGNLNDILIKDELDETVDSTLSA